MDWTKSGRTDWFEFRRIDAGAGVDGTEQALTGITGGSLTWNWFSDTEVSGSLTASNTPMLQNAIVRVYLCSRLGDDTERIELATCFAHTSRGHYEHGVYSGEIELVGTLARYTEDKMWKDWSIPKGGSALTYLGYLMRYLGGVYVVKGVKDKKFSTNKIVEFGKSPYTAINVIASVCDAQVNADSHGRLVFEPYVSAANKPVKGEIPSGVKSLTLDGIDIESTQNGTPNRAAVMYKYKETYTSGGKQKTRERVIYGLASTAKSSVTSAQRAGRFITETYTPKEMKPQTQARANQLAATYLKQAGGFTTSYTFNMLYYPVHIGEVWGFKHGSIRCDGIITQIDMQLVPGAPMTVTMRRVRSR